MTAKAVNSQHYLQHGARQRKSPTGEVAAELDLHSVGTAGFERECRERWSRFRRGSPTTTPSPHSELGYPRHRGMEYWHGRLRPRLPKFDSVPPLCNC